APRPAHYTMAASMIASRSPVVISRKASAPRPVVAVHAAARPVWFPGNPAPAHLDGTLAGDYGFDPLFLGQEPKTLAWYVQAELVHGRWAMLGAAGIILTSIGAKVGLGFPEWYDAGKVVIAKNNIDFPTLLITQLFLMGWAETKRWYDFKSPGSQGDGSFLGFTDEFKGTENGYPGGRFFDFMGLSRGDAAKYAEYKTKEIKNGRLAMLANLGFAAQYAATGKGPLDNLADHLADPAHVTFATNGVSIPIA
ncbi:Chlorophyll a-b binding protein 7, chloroplastic, partial [Tetrabaena socialis]